MPVSGIATDAGFEYSTQLCQYRDTETSLRKLRVHLNWLQGRQRGVIFSCVQIFQLQTTAVHHHTHSTITYNVSHSTEVGHNLVEMT